jgi:hypothetical protein
MIILEGSGDIRWLANAQNSNQDDASGRQSKQSIVNCIQPSDAAELAVEDSSEE